MNRARASLTVLLALAVSAAGYAHGVAVTPAAARGEPGEFVTVTYEIQGDGTYEFTVESPEGWTPVTRTRTLHVDGHATVPVTFRVPRLAPVGPSPALTLRVMDGATELTRATTTIDVTPRAALALRVPDPNMVVPANQDSTFPVYVSNLGNTTDTVTLSSAAPAVKLVFDPPRLTLAPGTTGVVNVTLVPQGVTSPGYQYVVLLRATSSTDPAVTSAMEVRQTGRLPDVANAEASGPQLRLGVSASAAATLDVKDGVTTASVTYGVTPTLSGQLSDYVGALLPLGTWQGSVADPVPRGFSFGVSFLGPAWSLDVGADATGGTVNGSALLAGWDARVGVGVKRFGSGTSYGVSAAAQHDLGVGQLGLNGSTGGVARDGGTGSSRTDALGARYAFPLSDTASATVAASAVGTSVDGVYTVGGAAAQSLSWQAETFDVSESYAGTTSGTHTLSVTGGTRSTAPFGVRVGAVAQLQPDGFAARASTLLLARPLPGLSATLGGTYVSSTLPGTRSSWSLTPTVAYSARLGDVGMSMNVGGSLVTRPGDTLGSDMALRGGLGLSFDRYDANLDAQWNDGVVNDARRRELDVGFGLGATLGDADRVNVGYTLAWQPDGLTQHTLNGQWQHLWTRDAQSSVTYGRSYALRLDGPTTLTESLGLGVTLTNVIGPNVGVSVGYRLNGEGGLLGGTVAQRLTAGVSTNVALAFDTPAPVVDLFGGRVGGEVSGRLFVDENANGRRDDGERVLAGVRVSVSRASAVTDADGAYVLRVSKGAHTLEVSGLPVTLDVLGRASVDVPENGRVTRDVAVSRVDSLEVSVVDDTNRNGALDADESFVPYARVTIEGPVTRTAVADRRGVVRVSGLPAGRYVVTLDPAGLPDRYEPLSAPPTVELREGERPAPVVLTAAEKPRQQISSFATGSLALLGALGDDEVDRGGSTVMRLRVQGHADDMTVEAFGRTFAVTGTGPDREATIVVPADVQPGTYEVVATARGASTVRTVRRWVAVR